MSSQPTKNDDGRDGPASPRTTIVGGQPSKDPAALPPIPAGLQQLLRLAAVDEEFRRLLVDQRAGAARAAGIALRAAEAAILDAVSASQLEQMAMSMPSPMPRRRAFLRQTAATAVVLLGGAALGEAVAACGSTPPEPTTPPEPITPQFGVRPDVPPPPPPQLDGGADVPPMPQFGVRPDVPPPSPQQDGGIDETAAADAGLPEEPIRIMAGMSPTLPRTSHPLPNAGASPNLPDDSESDR